ncbi:hypothetical protein Acr_25g0001310 [Actinidia rufa]|uniref:Uncharacterized protein n=1 Tax=Actinidia rufa TaxID=165716 RepID=A0A7J0GY43_9ERIC|nr:hypothetical protein Acr_25g0001310 [Actinidia rufa]
MELNRAQLLVCDDRALEKFKVAHGIPTDVTIEHPGSNNIPHIVAERPDRISVHIWLIHQAGLQFPIRPMLKEVMAHCHLTFTQVSLNFVCTVLSVDTLMNILDKPFSASDMFHIYTVVWPKKESGNPLYNGNHYLRMTAFAFGHFLGITEVYPIGSTTSSNSIPTIIRRLFVLPTKESRDVEALLEYEPYYQHRIPRRTADFIRANLPPLRMEGRAPQREAFSPEVSGHEEGYATSSSGRSSPNHISKEEKEEASSQLILNRRWSQVVPTPDFEARDANYAFVVQAQGKAVAVEAALTKLQLAACGPVYERVFTRGANWAGDNYSRQLAKAHRGNYSRLSSVLAQSSANSLSCLAKRPLANASISHSSVNPGQPLKYCAQVHALPVYVLELDQLNECCPCSEDPNGIHSAIFVIPPAFTSCLLEARRTGDRPTQPSSAVVVE